MSARLHVLLGAGGVGKTTLAAGYAIALARAGGNVGLLGIDPARRLQTALGLALGDRAAPLPSEPRVLAALLTPHDTLRRWAAESAESPEAHARLLANPFFVALSDRLATATDVLAAARIAEWRERETELTDLVVDTAPGLNAIDFLRRPRAIAGFLEGRLVVWLRRLARAQAPRGAARRLLDVLGRIGGASVVHALAELFALVEAPFATMLERLAVAQAWLAAPSTRILLVTTVRDDAARAATEIAEALRALHLPPYAVVVNRAVPTSLGEELTRIEKPAEAAGFVRYVAAYAAMQASVVDALMALAPRFVALPAARGLDEEGRGEALAGLGERLRGALE